MVCRRAGASTCGVTFSSYFHVIAGNKESQAREGSRLCSKARARMGASSGGGGAAAQVIILLSCSYTLSMLACSSRWCQVIVHTHRQSGRGKCAQQHFLNGLTSHEWHDELADAAQQEMG